MALRSNLVMPRLVLNHYGTEARQKGENILIPLPSAMTVSSVTPAAYAPDPQNVAPTTASIPLTNWYESAFTLNEQEIGNIVNGIAPLQLSAAMQALAFEVNSTIFSNYTSVGSGPSTTTSGTTTTVTTSGSPGTTPFASAPNVATGAATVLTNAFAPMADRKIVLSPSAWGNAVVLPQFAYALYAGDKDAVDQGIITKKFGFDWAQDQQVPIQTAGTITTGLIAKASTAVTAGSVSFLAHTAASTGACALNAGDVVFISGQNTTGPLAQGYALSAACTEASAATDVTMTLATPLAYALAGSETITVAPTHTVNLAFHREAFAFASRPLQGDNMGEMDPEMSHSVTDPVSGIALRLIIRREYHRTRAAFDILWGTACVRPALASRIFG